MQLHPWQVLSSRIIHRTPWIEVIEDECLTEEGEKLTYTYIRRVDEGATIIAEENDGRLWLVQQYRHPIRKVVWQFPSEGKKEGEERRVTAVRGLAEELGKQAKELIPLQVVYPDAGTLQQSDAYFLARGLSDISGVTPHHADEVEIEHLNTQVFTLTEIEELIQKGEICDNWTFSALYLYQRYIFSTHK
jgi:8-oxo-dGTP pyrophosphatase MutT (NUDIX family)